MFLGRATVWYNMLKGSTGTYMRKPSLQATQRALIHTKPSHGGMPGKKSDWLGKEADSLKGGLKVSKKPEIDNSVKEWDWQNLDLVPGVSMEVEATLRWEEEVTSTGNRLTNNYLLEQTSCAYKLFPISCVLSFLAYASAVLLFALNS